MAMQNAKKRLVKRFPIKYTQPSLTEQTHARACDINTIMAKYLKTGVLEHIKQYEPQFGDVSDLDFKAAMDTAAAVKSEFHNLPAYVRQHYQQDPARYLEAVSTDEGIQELRALKPPGQRYEANGSPEVAPEAVSAPQAAEPQEGDTTVT